MSDDTMYWVRWVAVLCLAFAVVPFLLLLRVWSISRVRGGNRAITGTSWMLPPNYREATRNDDDISVVAPPYRRSIGDDDLGYYDQNGVFISKPEVAVTRVVSHPSLNSGNNTPIPLSRAPSYNWHGNQDQRNVTVPSQAQASEEAPVAPPPEPAARASTALR